MPTSLTTLTTAILSPAALALLGTTAIKATLILAIASALALLLRRSAASTRHLLWTTALAGIVLLPALNVVLPEWYVSLPGADGVRALGTRLLPPPEERLSFKVSTAPTETPAAASAVGTSAPPRAGTTRSVTPRSPSTVNADVPSGSFTATMHDVAIEDNPSTRSPVTILLEIWLAGVVLALVPLLVGRWQLSRLARDARDVESDALDDYAARLGRSLGVTRVVRLVEGEASASPMTWGTLHPVILVPAGFEGWSEEHQRDVLLHELAHVARYDCLTQNVARIACALYWFNPLAWVAARQLRIERERSCDDRVLLAGARASSYAEHLLTIARTLHAPGATPVAALAMARPSQLEGRLLALLDARRARGAVTTRAAALSAGAAIVLAAALAALQPWSARVAAAAESSAASTQSRAIGTSRDADSVRAGSRRNDSSSTASARMAAQAAPAKTAGRASSSDSTDGSSAALHQFEPMRATLDAMKGRLENGATALQGAVTAKAFTLPGCEIPPKSGTSTQVLSDDDDHLRAHIKHGQCQITLEIQGKVTYNDQFTDVATLARDGWFEIADKGGTVEHKLHIDTDDNGALTRTWTVDGKRASYDDAARQWLAQTLTELDRYTQFSNGARMAVVFKKSGVNGVLDELQTTSSDYAKRENLGRLFKLAQLNEAQIGRVLDMIRTSFSSDYDRSEVLRSLVEEGTITPALQEKYIAAAAGNTSGYERGRSLEALTNTGKLTVASQIAIYKAAANTSSDYDRAQLMKSVMKKYGLSVETAPAFLQTAKSITSDYDLRTLLTEALDELPKNAPPAMIESMLGTATANIESEYDLAEFLITVANWRPLDDAQRARIEHAADSVKDEYNYGRVMSALHRRKTNSL